MKTTTPAENAISAIYDLVRNVSARLNRVEENIVRILTAVNETKHSLLGEDGEPDGDNAPHRFMKRVESNLFGAVESRKAIFHQWQEVNDRTTKTETKVKEIEAAILSLRTLMTDGNDAGESLTRIESMVKEIRNAPDAFLRDYFRGDADAMKSAPVPDHLTVFCNGKEHWFDTLQYKDKHLSGESLRSLLEIPKGDTLFQVLSGVVESAVGRTATAITDEDKIKLEEGMRFFSIPV